MKIFYILTFIAVVHARINPVIVQKILQQSYLKSVTLLHCDEDIGGVFKISKDLSRINPLVSINVHDMNLEEDHEQFLSWKNYNTFVLIDIDCVESEDVLNQLTNKKAINGSYNIMAFGSDWNTSLDILGKQGINFDSKVYLVKETVTEEEDTHEIFDVYSLEHLRGTPLIFNRVGIHSNQESFLGPSHKIIRDFQQHTLLITTNIPKTPHGEILLEYLKGIGGQYKDNMNRLGNRVLILVSELYNFRIHWIRSTSWGYVIDKNFTFDGCIGTLQSNEAHACACSLIVTPIRLREIDSGFSIPLFRQMFIFRHPRSGKSVGGLGNIFLRPLTTEVWICLAAVSVLATIILYVTHRYDDESTTFSELFVTAIGILSNQGISVTLISAHTRIAALFFIFLGFVLFNFYSASIVGSLLTPPQRNIRDMKRLMNSDIKMILQDIPSSKPVFQFFALGKEFYAKRIEGKEVVMLMEDGLNYVQKGGYAFFAYVDTAYDIIKRTFTADEMDDLIEIKFYQRTVDENMYFPVKKYSWFREPVKIGVQKLAETGLGKYWKKRWMLKPPVGNLDSLKMVPVDLAHFSTVLYLLLVGFGISLVIFVGELVCASLKKRNIIKNSRLI